jgi:hypothetical protein
VTGVTALNAAQLERFAAAYTAAWCSQDASSVAAFFGSNALFQINRDAPAVGTTAITAEAQAFMTGFPDMVVAMDSLKVVGSEVFWYWTMTGTNSGPGGTGNAVKFSGYEVWKLGADGLIADCRGHFDEAEYARQLREGIAKAPGDIPIGFSGP